LEEPDYICDAIVRGFSIAEEQFGRLAEEQRCSSGATGVFVLLDGNNLYVANLGDCRAVLCRCTDGKAQSHRLTELHNCTEVSEIDRLKKIDAKISHGYLEGQIEVTRSFGDFQWNTVGNKEKIKGLIAYPHVSKMILTEQDEFLVIATDGLWDVLTEMVSVSCCRRLLRKNANCCEAAQRLMQTAQMDSVDSQTSDNATVAVIGFARPDQSGLLRIGPRLDDLPCSRLQFRKSLKV